MRPGDLCCGVAFCGWPYSVPYTLERLLWLWIGTLKLCIGGATWARHLAAVEKRDLKRVLAGHEGLSKGAIVSTNKTTKVGQGGHMACLPPRRDRKSRSKFAGHRRK